MSEEELAVAMVDAPLHWAEKYQQLEAEISALKEAIFLVDDNYEDKGATVNVIAEDWLSLVALALKENGDG